MPQVQIAVGDLVANPFRHIDRYPIRREKVEALKSSLETTGFWGNIVARQQNGTTEIAYGHHRLVALKEYYGNEELVEIIVRDLSDEDMLQIMARENMEEWGTSAWVEHETVRAVVEAYAQGLIDLPHPSPSTPKRSIRHAPSFTSGGVPLPAGERPYTADILASFLGWTQSNGKAQNKVLNALSALQFIEEGILSEADFVGLTTMQAEAVVGQARKVKADREAAAKLAARQAEQARREAEAAAERRIRAEELRKEQSERAAKARSQAARQQAEQRAQEAAAERRRAEQELQAAERRRADQERREQEEREKAREQATIVGHAVSQDLQAGRIGYKGAAAVRERVAEKVEGPPRDLDDIARQFSAELGKILRPDDIRAQKLEVLVEYKDSMKVSTRNDLVTTLNRLASWAAQFAQDLGDGESQSKREHSRLPERTTIDGDAKRG